MTISQDVWLAFLMARHRYLKMDLCFFNEQHAEGEVMPDGEENSALMWSPTLICSLKTHEKNLC